MHHLTLAHEVRVAPTKVKKSVTRDSKLDRTVKHINGLAKANDEPNDNSTQNHDVPAPVIDISDAPTIVIKSEKDMKKHEAAVMKLMAALPSNPKKLAKAARKIGNLELGEGEILAMVDSGISFTPSMLSLTCLVTELKHLKGKIGPTQLRLHVVQY